MTQIYLWSEYLYNAPTIEDLFIQLCSSQNLLIEDYLFSRLLVMLLLVLPRLGE